MEWGFGEVVVGKPTAHLADHLQLVVDAENQEVGEFYPHAGIAHGEDGVEDGLEVAAADFPVDVVVERLQVDVGSVEVWQQVGQWFLTDVARRDEDIPETRFVSQTGAVSDVLDIGQRLRVGVGDAWTMVLQTERYDLFGRKAVVVGIGGRCLRDVVVLAVQTAEVAAGAGDGEALCAGVEMVEGLLLDGVDGQRTRLTIDIADESAVQIATATADARLAVGDTAVVRTEQTLNSAARRFVISALVGFHQKTMAS